jgi:hypothetical protein
MGVFDFLRRKMLPRSSDPLQQIAAALIDVFDGSADPLMLYAEVRDGVVAPSAFRARSPVDLVLKLPSSELANVVETFWRSGTASIPARSWAAMTLVVREGEFKLSLTYPEQMNPEERVNHRRPRVVETWFPGANVDVSEAMV